MRRRLYWMWLLAYVVIAGLIVGFEPILARLVQAGAALQGVLLLYAYGVRVLVVLFGALLAWPLRWAGAGTAVGTGAAAGPGGAWVRGSRAGRASARAVLALSLVIALVLGFLPVGVILALFGVSTAELPSVLSLALGSPTVGALALVWLGAVLVGLFGGAR